MPWLFSYSAWVRRSRNPTRRATTGHGKPPAKRHLEILIADREVKCFGWDGNRGRDRYGRQLAICHVWLVVHLNIAMVRDGWALAYYRDYRDYGGEERTARNDLAGMWRGEFQEPWEWRKEMRKRKPKS